MACYSYWESLQYVSTVGSVSGVSGLWHSKASWCRLLPPPAPAQPWLPATNAKSLSGAYDVYLWTPPPQEPDSPMVCDGVNTELVTMQCMQLASSVAGGFRSCLRQFRSCSGHVQVMFRSVQAMPLISPQCACPVTAHRACASAAGPPLPQPPGATPHIRQATRFLRILCIHVTSHAAQCKASR